MIKTLNPGEYIVTAEGYRGYVVEAIDGDMYTIRLASGYTVRHIDHLELDRVMEEVV